MAETDGRSVANQPIWSGRAPSGSRRDGPLLARPALPPQASPSKPLQCTRHYIFVCWDLDWRLWHGVQRALIDEFARTPQRQLRGRKSCACPGHACARRIPPIRHLVRIVEELSAGGVYSAAKPPQPFRQRLRRLGRRVKKRHARAPGSDWEPEILFGFRGDRRARLQRGPFKAQG